MRLKKGICFYDTPKSCERVISVGLKKGGRYWSLVPIHYADMWSMKARPNTPIYYAYHDGELRLHPTPDKAYFVQVIYTDVRKM